MQTNISAKLHQSSLTSEEQHTNSDNFWSKDADTDSS